MNNLFKMDGLFFKIMDKIGDVFVLNIAFVLCCIPILTIGPALIAFYYVLHKMQVDDEVSIFKTYIQAFKENFKKGFIAGNIMLGLGGLFAFDLYYLVKSGIEFSGLLMIGIMICVIIYLFILVYLFPMMSRYENTIKNQVKNAFLLSLKHLPKSIILVIMFLLIALVIKILPSLSPLLFVFGFYLIGNIQLAFMKQIFSSYEEAVGLVTCELES